MISEQKQFIFIHIPKTAGNAIQNILRRYSEDEIVCNTPYQDGVERFEINNSFGLNKHATAQDYLARLGYESYHKKFKFTCVRNPWDRAISYYFSPHRGVNTWNRTSFIDFLEEIQPMTAYLPDIEQLGMVMRYEQLLQDFKALCEQLSLPYEALPVRNKSVNSSPYWHYYDDELKKMVASKFANDIELFGYQFAMQ